MNETGDFAVVRQYVGATRRCTARDEAHDALDRLEGRMQEREGALSRYIASERKLHEAMMERWPHWSDPDEGMPLTDTAGYIALDDIALRLEQLVLALEENASPHEVSRVHYELEERSKLTAEVDAGTADDQIPAATVEAMARTLKNLPPCDCDDAGFCARCVERKAVALTAEAKPEAPKPQAPAPAEECACSCRKALTEISRLDSRGERWPLYTAVDIADAALATPCPCAERSKWPSTGDKLRAELAAANERAERAEREDYGKWYNNAVTERVARVKAERDLATANERVQELGEDAGHLDRQLATAQKDLEIARGERDANVKAAQMVADGLDAGLIKGPIAEPLTKLQLSTTTAQKDLAEAVEAAAEMLDALDNAPDEWSTSELRAIVAKHKGVQDAK